MTENRDESSFHPPGDSVHRGDSAANDSRQLKTPVANTQTLKEHGDVLKLQRFATSAEREISPYQPRPPSLPKLSKGRKSGSLEETRRTRKLRNSQESLSDTAGTGNSTDSLKDDQEIYTSGGFVLNGDRALKNNQDATMGPARKGSLEFGDSGSSQSECDGGLHIQDSYPTEIRGRSTKVRLSPVQPLRPLPALDKSLASGTLRAANRIDRDCLDNCVLAQEKPGERLHRNLSDSRLLENMGSYSASVNSVRSAYSVLSPIRSQDVRHRYSAAQYGCSDGNVVKFTTTSHITRKLQAGG